MKKKILTAAVLLVSAALLVAASVLGTLSFLASSTAVSNTFTVGDVTINMLESKTDENGVDLDDTDRTSDGNSYRLIPNKQYVKDPAIFVNANSTPSFLFVKIRNGISTIEKEGTTIKEQMVAHGWQIVKANDYGEELYLYVGVGNAFDKMPSEIVATDPAYVVSPKWVGSAEKETIEVFDTFTVAENAVVADYAGAKVTLTAFAIQKEGFEATQDGLEGYKRAWNAIVNRFPYESGTEFAALLGD